MPKRLPRLSGSKRTSLDNDLLKYMEMMAAMEASMNEKRDRTLKYDGVTSLYLKEGRLFSSEPFTKEELEIIREHLPQITYRVRECYKNAAIIATSGGSATVPFEYAEGIALGNTIPVQHAWVTLNNKPIDVTWRARLSDRNTRRISTLVNRIKENHGIGSYFGVIVPRPYLLDHLAEGQVYSPYVEGIRYDHRPVVEGFPWRNKSRSAASIGG